MSYEAHNHSFEATLKAALLGTYPAVLIQYENTPLNQPEGPWVASFLVDGKARQLELGKITSDRHVGFAQVEVLVPQQTGTKMCRAIAETIGNAFRRQTVFGLDGCRIIYQVPEYIARGEHKGFFCIMMRVAYWRDEPRA